MKLKSDYVEIKSQFRFDIWTHYKYDSVYDLRNAPNPYAVYQIVANKSIIYGFVKALDHGILYLWLAVYLFYKSVHIDCEHFSSAIGFKPISYFSLFLLASKLT